MVSRFGDERDDAVIFTVALSAAATIAVRARRRRRAVIALCVGPCPRHRSRTRTAMGPTFSPTSVTLHEVKGLGFCIVALTTCDDSVIPSCDCKSEVCEKAVLCGGYETERHLSHVIYIGVEQASQYMGN